MLISGGCVVMRLRCRGGGWNAMGGIAWHKAVDAPSGRCTGGRGGRRIAQ